MKRISSKSKLRVWRLITPPTDKTRIDQNVAARRLTVRALIHHKRNASLWDSATMIVTKCDHLISIGNMVRHGFDYIG